MAACGSCGAGNPDGYRFCGSCGRELGLTVCASCGESNPSGQAFCGHCGRSTGDIDYSAPDSGSLSGSGSPTQLSPRPIQLSGSGQLRGGPEERKLATVLFADVVGFTSLADRTDPEVVTRMVDTAFRRLSEVVTAHGGTVDKYMGDSVMAVFGVPVAHDDDAERGVAAGLAMRELGGDLAFSIGINSGEVMAAAVGGDGDMTVIGDTVNVAARLEKVASAGEVLCGRLTVDLAESAVVFRERQPVLLKGKRDPVEVFEAIAVRDRAVLPPREDAVFDGPPFIGRADELAFLESLWRRVCRDRRAQVVVLCGEAGCGKTRLVSELVGSASRDGTVVRAAFPGYGAMGGSRVASEIVRQLGPSDDSGVNARVRSASGNVESSLSSVDPGSLRQEQLWAFRRLLHEKSDGGPVLVVIDDMHRSGDQTLELLSELAGRVDDVPLLTVLVGRSEPVEWLGRFHGATRLPLGPLSREDSAALASSFVSEKPLSASTVDFLVDRANGNPLYLRELNEMLRVRGLLVEDGGEMHLGGLDGGGSQPAVTAHAALSASVPATLQALLAARLDALDPEHKLVVQHVAVVGEPATDEQVAALGHSDATSALRHLADLGLLRQGHDGRYDTVDPMLREVAYETLPRHVRGELHRKAAQTAVGAEERARHLDRAANYLADDETAITEAADALADAGMDLIAASRVLDGLRVLERAVARGCRRTSALLELARTQAVCGRQDDARETLALIEDDPDDPSIAVERDHTAAGTRMFTDPDIALPGLLEAAAQWRAMGNLEKEAWATANAGVAYFYSSRMEEAASSLERSLGLFEEIGDENGIVSTSSFLCLARPTDRRVPGWLDHALEFAEKAGDRSKEMTVLTTLAWHHFFRSFYGNPQEMADAAAYASRMAELAEELGANDLAVHGLSLLALMSRLTGRFEEASGHIAALERVARLSNQNDRWFAWAVTFSVTVARGAWGVTPPFPPEGSADPVAAMAALVVEAELGLAGRVEEAYARFERTHRPDLGPIGDVGSLLNAVSLVLAGRPADALVWADRCARAAVALDAPPAAQAAAALRAEITGDLDALPPAPGRAEGLSDVLVLRARASHGNAPAAAALEEAIGRLSMPGLAMPGPAITGPAITGPAIEPPY
jgi:class 3 adenylate cyclase/tetratricopeptide (TPR) repeat protein